MKTKTPVRALTPDRRQERLHAGIREQVVKTKMPVRALTLIPAEPVLRVHHQVVKTKMPVRALTPLAVYLVREVIARW